MPLAILWEIGSTNGNPWGALDGLSEHKRVYARLSTRYGETHRFRVLSGDKMGFAAAQPILPSAEGNVTDQTCEIHNNLTYATHDGVELKGDLYLPVGAGPFPIVVNVHGGYWRRGSRDTFQHWGPYLCGARIWRLYGQLPADQARPEDLSGRGARHSRGGAIRSRARQGFPASIPAGSRCGEIPPAPIWPRWWRSPAMARCSRAAIRSDAHAKESSIVNVLIGTYGIYDLLTQWRYSQLGNPGDNLVECIDRGLAHEGSPYLFRCLATEPRDHRQQKPPCS